MASADQAARRFLLVVLIASLALVGMVAWPLAYALLLAAVLAVVLSKLQARLARSLGGRRQLAAGILVFAVLLVLIGPVVAMSAYAVNEASAGLKFIVDTVHGEGVNGLIDRLPAPLDRAADAARAWLGDLGNLVETQISRQGGKAASALGVALLATGELVFQGAMMLIALFFLLASGQAMLAWIDEALPLRRGQIRELAAEFTNVSYAVIVSTLVTAGLQAAVALVGYLIARVPYALFFAAVTFFVALIPAAAVCLFAAFVLLVTGHPYMAAFLAVWGVVVVGLVDNVAKPYLIKGDTEMHGAVVFFALIGGIAAFGMVGLLIGPLSVALFLAVLRIYRRDYGPAA
jgi:predicted PurR-regulated permease PerM